MALLLNKIIVNLFVEIFLLFSLCLKNYLCLNGDHSKGGKFILISPLLTFRAEDHGSTHAVVAETVALAEVTLSPHEEFE